MGLASRRRVLLTGAAGGVGSILRRGLRDHYAEFVLLDLEPLEPETDNERCLQVDLRDREATFAAVRDVDAVLHLGAIPVEAPFEDILDSNLRGTYHVLEACRRTGIPRFVFASSHHTMGFYPRDVPVDASMPVRPDSFYGASKVYGEALGRMYHDQFGLEVVCVRIGTVIDRPTDRRTLSTWSSPGDTVDLFRRCVDAGDVGFSVVYGVSGNQRRWWFDDGAGDALGYVPRDDAERYAAEIEAEPESQPEPELPPAERFQGGSFVEWDEELTGTGSDPDSQDDS